MAVVHGLSIITFARRTRRITKAPEVVILV